MVCIDEFEYRVLWWIAIAAFWGLVGAYGFFVEYHRQRKNSA